MPRRAARAAPSTSIPTAPTAAKAARTTMRISATGRTEGFTLVELLIVLTIVGLMSAAVVLAMPDPRGNLSAEAEQFAARAAAARNLAIVDAEALSMRGPPIGYGLHQIGRRAGRERGGT